jgi:hypothetical protein
MRLKIEPEKEQLHWISDEEIRVKLAQAKRLENLAIVQQRALNSLKKNSDLIHPNPRNIEYVERVLARLDELEVFMGEFEKELGI